MTTALDRAVHVKLAQMWVARLKTARKDQGVTQKQLGARIGVGKSLIRNWECFVHLPAVPSLMAWGEALGWDLYLDPADPRRFDARLLRLLALLALAEVQGSEVVSVAAVRKAMDLDNLNDKEDES